MRITGGSLVRRRFLIPDLVDDNVVRPTPDRVREAVFSMIKNYLAGAYVLDIFAGSGSHGFEAISRGADFVNFVERNESIISVIKNNIKSLGLDAQCKITKSDALSYVNDRPERIADVVFVDPPYSLVLDELFFINLKKHLSDNGIVIFRCFKKEKINFEESFSIERDRNYGGTRVLILVKKNTAPNNEHL
jgi:16S rRNA (guanine(966)-N(2))-methyltransferase RsmD